MAENKKPKDSKTDKPEKKGPPPMPMRGLAISFLMVAVFLTVLHLFSGSSQPTNEIDYSDFVNMVKNDRISKVVISHDGAGNEFITGESKDLNAAGTTQFRAEIILTENLITLMEDHAVHIKKKRPKTMMWSVIANIVPFILIFGVIYFIFIRQMKNAGRGAMSFGKSRAKLLTQDKNKITFNEVAGVDEAKEELNEVVEFLKDPKRFQNLGGKMPKGVLLSGAPGTGKTLLAKAVAGEADVPFFTISGSDFVEMFVGIGASRVRDMFEQGKKNAPCIIFIDEIDAVGRSRFSGIGGGHDEREQTLNALLVEMDGFDTQEGIIIVAATNRPDVLDPALLRPGRFDRQVEVDLPTLEGREQILKIHSRNVRLSDKVELKRSARGTPGFSGADLANLVNEAALLASRRGADFVEQEDMEEARDKVMWGRERRSHVLDAEEKKLTAYHEAGHAVAMYHTPECEPIHKVTIIPRGRALGATMSLPEKDRYTQSQKRLEADLVSLMGGRAAEELIFGDVTTGAHNDIERATMVARAMVCEYGMSKLLGPQNLGSHSQPVFLGQGISGSKTFSEQTSQQIDQEVQRILTEAFDTSMKILTDNKNLLITLSELLIEREVLDFEEVDSIMKTGKLPEKPETEAVAEPAPETTVPEAVEEEAEGEETNPT
ncbi:ATP-dependent zinc metalloprotease FtsH [Pontiella sulfatireligans]|uniref:ATP-dependent zinc metalloprotease FtsH n=1 Tax=Pontiella sulfatireligans TaxID=2750658 RepID=A0A6C2UN67_9BACT|nr:ATP-dependent zinc metalloprotease FtsH [Pontiella sulfatireligans]VGO21383.1 ATP-dependent zinc metalloprotease FtsH [Pontiella sulfatireligans]